MNCRRLFLVAITGRVPPLTFFRRTISSAWYKRPLSLVAILFGEKLIVHCLRCWHAQVCVRPNLSGYGLTISLRTVWWLGGPSFARVVLYLFTKLREMDWNVTLSIAAHMPPLMTTYLFRCEENRCSLRTLGQHSRAVLKKSGFSVCRDNLAPRRIRCATHSP